MDHLRVRTIRLLYYRPFRARHVIRSVLSLGTGASMGSNRFNANRPVIASEDGQQYVRGLSFIGVEG